MTTTLRMKLLPLAIGSLVVACSGGSTPAGPVASSARDVEGGFALHETTPGAGEGRVHSLDIGVGNSSGGAAPVDPKVSSAGDFHAGFPPHGSTNGGGGGGGRVHPFDSGSCITCNPSPGHAGEGCGPIKCPNSFFGGTVGTDNDRSALYSCSDSICANSSDSAKNGGGGAIAYPVIELVFWGSQWSNATPSVGAVQASLEFLVNSTDYFAGINQYGTQQVMIDQVVTNTDLTSDPNYWGDPPSGYAENDVQTMVNYEMATGYIPGDPDGNDTIYLVMMPPGTTPPPDTCGANGANVQWVRNVAYVAFTDLDHMTETASHEIVEAITDPGGPSGGNGWTMDRSLEDDGSQIADACTGLADFIDGAVRVQSYWSNSDHSCIIPYPPTCGNEWQSCCSDGATCTGCASSSDVCFNGLCQPPCGGFDQACCLPGNTGTTCTASGTVCNSTLGRCLPPLAAPSCPTDYSTCTGANNDVVDAVFECNGPASGDTFALQQETSPGNWQTLTPTVSEVNGVWTANQLPQTNSSYRVCVNDAFGQTTCTPTISLTPAVCSCVPNPCTGAPGECGTNISNGCGGTESCTCCPSGEVICPLDGLCMTLTKCNEIGSGSGGGGHCKPGTCN
jgi:hypothetical protein